MWLLANIWFGAQSFCQQSKRSPSFVFHSKFHDANMDLFDVQADGAGMHSGKRQAVEPGRLSSGIADGNDKLLPIAIAAITDLDNCYVRICGR